MNLQIMKEIVPFCNGSFLYNGFFFQFLYLGLPYNTPYSFGGVVPMMTITTLVRNLAKIWPIGNCA